MKKILILTIIVCFLVAPFQGVMGQSWASPIKYTDSEAVKECKNECYRGEKFPDIESKYDALSKATGAAYDVLLDCRKLCREEEKKWDKFYYDSGNPRHASYAAGKVQPCYDACNPLKDKHQAAQDAKYKYFNDVYTPAKDKCYEECENVSDKVIESITISKTGFIDKTVSVEFINGIAYISVYMTTWEDEEQSVGGALIKHKTNTYKSSLYGPTKLTTEDKGDGQGKAETKRIEIELIPANIGLGNKARIAYENVNQGYVSEEFPVESDLVELFIEEFGKYMAVEDDEGKLEQFPLLLKAIGSSLTFMHDYKLLSDDSAEMFSGTLSSSIWDLLDLFLVLGKFGTQAREFMERIGKVAASKILNKIPRLAMFLSGTPTTVVKSIWNRIEHGILYGTRHLDPRILHALYVSLVEPYIVKFSQDIVNKIPENIEFSEITLTASDILKVLRDKRNQKLMSYIEWKIRNFTPYNAEDLEERIDYNQSVYLKFSQEYLEKHEIEYKTTMGKAYTELVMTFGQGIIMGAVVITQPQFYKMAYGILEGIEKVYKVVRSTAINNIQLISWADHYGRNLISVRKTVIDIMKIKFKKRKSSLIPVAYAQESPYEMLYAIYDNEAELDDPDRQKVLEYYEALADKEFYEEMATLSQGFAELIETEELNNLSTYFTEELAKIDIQTKYDEIKDLDIIQPIEEELDTGVTITRLDDKESKSKTWLKIILTIIFLGLIAGAYFFILRKLGKKKLAIIVMACIGVILILLLILL